MRRIRNPRDNNVAIAGLLVMAVAAVVLIALAFRASNVADAGSAPGVGLRTPHAGAVKAKPLSLWVGDDYPAGYGATSTMTAESCLTATALRWTCSLDAEVGTGFTTAGSDSGSGEQTLIQRLGNDMQNFKPAVVIIDAGRNDTASLRKEESAIGAYDLAVRRAFPDAVIVQIAPYILDQKAAPFGGKLAGFITDEMKSVGGYAIDPKAEGWADPNIARLSTQNTTVLTPAGHAFVADKLIRDFRRLGLIALVKQAASKAGSF